MLPREHWHPNSPEIHVLRVMTFPPESVPALDRVMPTIESSGDQSLGYAHVG